MLQRAVRHVLHAAAVRLLPVVGAQLAVPQEDDHRGDTSVQPRHPHAAGASARRTSHLAPSGCRSQMKRPSFIDVFAVVTDKA